MPRRGWVGRLIRSVGSAKGSAETPAVPKALWSANASTRPAILFSNTAGSACRARRLGGGEGEGRRVRDNYVSHFLFQCLDSL